jgi:hypothetical protein
MMMSSTDSLDRKLTRARRSFVPPQALSVGIELDRRALALPTPRVDLTRSLARKAGQPPAMVNTVAVPAYTQSLITARYCYCYSSSSF